MSQLLQLLLTLFATAAPATDVEERAPDPGAKPHEVYQWKTRGISGDLRYTWCLPRDYDPAQPRALTVILHGTGLDYRWGHWNNKPGVFRPDDVVVSVDGTSPQGEARVFYGERKDAEAFREFLTEMRSLFAVDRVFLYGHSQGGFFVVYYAGEFPETVDGVVAHASGAWNWSKTGKAVHDVAFAFMHGTSDPVVPYRQSPGSRDAYRDEGIPLLHLRRLDRYNHWPNAVRANECIAWCEGMTTDSPERALAAVESILEPKRADEYQWTTVVGFSGARDVLRRLEGKGHAPFAEVPAGLAERITALTAAVEEHGLEHVDVLRRSVPGEKALVLDDGEWLGHLVPLREDFRGVESVEAYFAEIRFDKALEAQSKAVKKILEVWYGNEKEGDKFEAIVAGLADAFLFEGYPPEMAKRLEEWEGDAKKLRISKGALRDYANVELWTEGWEKGRKEYEKLWKRWKLPK